MIDTILTERQIKLITEAAEGGNKDALRLLAILKAAQNDDREGQFFLGTVLQEGTLGEFRMEPLLKEASKCYLMAAEKGHIKAQIALGQMLENGDGIGKDIETALNWYRKAAKAGSDNATRAIGTLKRRLREPHKMYFLNSTPKKKLTINEVSSLIRFYDFPCQKATFSTHYIDNKFANIQGKGLGNEFMAKGKGNILFDLTTGLYWQQDISDAVMPFSYIETHLKQMNESEWGGYCDWRLPTLEEAFSLLRPVHLPLAKGYLDPLFKSSNYSSIWTSDTAEYDYWSWCLSTEGYAEFQDNRNIKANVRAVRSRNWRSDALKHNFLPIESVYKYILWKSKDPSSILYSLAHTVEKQKPPKYNAKQKKALSGLPPEPFDTYHKNTMILAKFRSLIPAE